MSIRAITFCYGLKDTVPLGKPYEAFPQMMLFDLFGDASDSGKDETTDVPCRTFDGRSKTSLKFMSIKKR